MMREVRAPFCTRLLHPKLVVIVTAAGRDGRGNAMTAAWAMPVSAKPPMVAVSIAPKRYTYELIKETGEFVLNVPQIDMLELVDFFGSVSGREVDKLSRVSTRPARRVKAPVIEGCAAWLECVVEKEVEAGDHVVFIARIVEAYGREDLVRPDGRYDVARFRPVLHMGGDEYASIEPEVYRA